MRRVALGVPLLVACHLASAVDVKGHIGLQIHPGNELLIRFKDIEVSQR